MAKVIAALASLCAKGKSRVIYDDFDNTIQTTHILRITTDGKYRRVSDGNARIISLPGPFIAIYREQPTPNGRILIRQRYFIPTDTWSQAKQDNRDKFALAVAEWSNLSIEQQIYWNKLRYPEHMSGYNRFIRNYMLN